MRPYADRMLELMVGTARASSSRPRPAAAPAARRCETVAILAADRRPRPGRRLQRAGPAARRSRSSGGCAARATRCAGSSPAEGRLDAALPPLRGRAGLDGLQRPARVRGRAGDRAPRRRALRRGRGRPRRGRLQPLRLAARPAGRRAGDPARSPSSVLEAGDEAESAGARRRLHLRARARADPRAAAARVRRDRALPRAARVGRVRAGRADDGDAQRLEERRRADRQPDAGDEPRPAGRDHPGDPRGRRRRGRALPLS